MANELVQGLFQSLLAPQQTQQNDPTAIMAAINSSNPMAAAMAYNLGSTGQVTKGLLGQISGGRLSTATPQEYMQQAVTASPELLQTSAGMQQLAQMAQQAGDRPTALRLSLMSQEKAVEEAQTQQQSMESQRGRTGLLNIVQGSSLPAAQKSAVGAAVMAGNFDGKADKLLEFAFPNKEAGERYRTVGNHVWDNTTGSWATGAAPTDNVAPQAVMTTSSLADLPGIDFDQYDPTSYASAERAYKAAETEEGRQSAIALLRPKLEAGEQWKMVNGVMVPWPETGAPRREAESAISAYNQSKSNVLRKSDVIINTVDNILTSIAEGKTTTGAASALGYIPGTTWWNQRMNVDTLRANLGFGELQSMRSAAANGASGLGQLTERELSRLEALVGSLSTAQSEPQFVQRMNDIRTFYADLKQKYTDLGDMTMEDYAGAPKAAQQRVTSPSGKAYTIEEVN